MIKRYDKNKYKITGDITEIYIHDYKTQELLETILIDTEDFNKVKDSKWVLNHCGYARNGNKGLMHRLIMNCVKNDGKIIDHINQNKLDNRKSNLRITNKTTNRINSKEIKGYRLRKRKKGDRYTAFIRVNGKQIILGTYDTPEEAQKVYLDKRREIYGE